MRTFLVGSADTAQGDSATRARSRGREGGSSRQEAWGELPTAPSLPGGRASTPTCARHGPRGRAGPSLGPSLT
ncbi:hypothetical protein LEMLEM_LOCUS22933, partial [Lemmus lemmus]